MFTNKLFINKTLTKKNLAGITCASLLSLGFAMPLYAGGDAESFQNVVAEIGALKPRENPEDLKKRQAMVEELRSIYRTNPLAPDAFDAMLYTMQFSQMPERNEIYGLLAKHYADHPDLNLVLNLPTLWMIFTGDIEKLLNGAIEKNTSPKVKATAQTSLAGMYLGTAEFLSSLDELNLTFDQFIDGQVEAMNNNVPPGGGKGPSITREGLLASIDAKAIEGRTGKGWRVYRNRAVELLESAKKIAGEETLYRYSYTAKGRELQPLTPLADKIAGIQYQIDNVAPGAKLPVVEGIVDLEGNSVKFSDHQGKVLLLDFWATWCGPCKAAMPHHRELVAHMKGRPFELITLSVDGDAEDVLGYIEDEDDGMPFTNWYVGPEHTVLGEWGIQGFPTVIVVDHKGIIRTRPAVSHEELSKYLDRLVSEAES